MMKRIRQFYWIAVATGILMSFQAFKKPDSLKSFLNGNYSENVKNDNFFNKLKNELFDLKNSVVNSDCNNCDRVSIEENNGTQYIQKSVIKKIPSDQKVRKSWNSSAIKKNNQNSDLPPEGYIYKDGKYYKSIAKNVYLDDKGTPTLYIDNSKVRYEKSTDENGNSDTSIIRSGTQKKNISNNTELSQVDPMTIQGMVKTIKQAKKNLNERNKVLEQMSK